VRIAPASFFCLAKLPSIDYAELDTYLTNELGAQGIVGGENKASGIAKAVSEVLRFGSSIADKKSPGSSSICLL
jgi:hypothetical protein